MAIKYTTYEDHYFEDYFELANKLFPDYSKKQLKMDLQHAINAANQETFFAVEDERLLGFVNVSIRKDYVEGATSSPVGYLEALYIIPQSRMEGIAKQLCQQAENWAKTQGCSQMGSDTWLTNSNSRAFHLKIGFKEEDILVHYIKDIAKK